ncbi:thioredoxin domain-containing protein [Microbacterium sp.]|uniref:DsbA family protein n=1 Tax=Microbacterium sp. TaxID=51671 RepID=UPI003342CD6D
MSSDETPNVPAASASRDAVREKAQQVHAQQSRARLMRRIIIGLVAVVAVGAIGTAVAWAVGSTVSKPLLQPSGMDGDGVPVTEVSVSTPQQQPAPTPTPGATQTADALGTEKSAADAVDIHIYVDYLSPGAGEFERANARQLAGWISEGAVKVTYHPVALLTASSNGTKYSLRAAAASACVATYAPKHFYDYNHELLTSQPAVDSDGRSDTELADLAGAVGVDNAKKVRSCIQNGDFISWAKDATARATEGPLPGTKKAVLGDAPMIVANGQTYVGSMKDPAEFSQFILTLSSDAYYGTSTPTPTPTPTSTPTPGATTPPATDDPATD